MLRKLKAALFRPEPQEQYRPKAEDLPSQYFAKLLPLYVERALARGAEELIFGVPRDEKWPAEADASLTWPYTVVGGRHGMSIWTRRSGQNEFLSSPPRSLYFQMLAGLELLLVRLGDSAEPREAPLFLELFRAANGARRFVRVGLSVAEDNTVRVALGELREEPEGTSAVLVMYETSARPLGPPPKALSDAAR